MTKQEHIFVTGGTGFFGKALLRHWAEQEFKGCKAPFVTLLSRDPDKFARQYPMLVTHRWLKMHRGDITDRSSLPLNTSFTQVLHCATDSTLGPQLDHLQRYNQIVDGTRNILDLAVACGASRFLLTSSGAVYGTQPPHLERIPEDWHAIPDPLNPDNTYGVGKRVAEHLCILYASKFGLPTVIARCFAFIGPDLPLNVHFAIGNFIRDALWRDEITVSGDGSPLRSYMDQKDLAEWLLTLLECGRAGQAYNVGSEQAISIYDLAHLVRNVVAPNKNVRIQDERNQSNFRNIYVPCTQKAGKEFDLVATVNLEQAIIKTANASRTLNH
jgi:UDP-glucuronate decarboxylase